MNFRSMWDSKTIAIEDQYGNLVANPYFDNWRVNTSITLSTAMSLSKANPTTQPRKHIMKCTRCGTSSMIPESTDKIMPLICPQCGSPLDA